MSKIRTWSTGRIIQFKYSEKNLSQGHFVCHKSHIDWPESSVSQDTFKVVFLILLNKLAFRHWFWDLKLLLRFEVLFWKIMPCSLVKIYHLDEPTTPRFKDGGCRFL
jgi:hypothetical protein